MFHHLGNDRLTLGTILVLFIVCIVKWTLKLRTRATGEILFGMRVELVEATDRMNNDRNGYFSLLDSELYLLNSRSREEEVEEEWSREVDWTREVGRGERKTGWVGIWIWIWDMKFQGWDKVLCRKLGSCLSLSLFANKLSRYACSCSCLCLCLCFCSWWNFSANNKKWIPTVAM